MSGDAHRDGPDRAFDPDRHIDAVAPLLGLAIAPAERPGVIRFLAVAQRMAAIVAAAPLPADDAELAPVFSPGGPPDAA